MKKYLPLAVIVLALSVYYFTPLGSLLTLESFAQNHSELTKYIADNQATAVLAFFTIYLLTTALSLPIASILTILGGVLFGWFVGAFVVILAASFGALCLFIAAKSAFGDILQKKAGPFLAKLREGFLQDSFNYLLFLRLVPLFPFWLVNLAPAFFNMKVLPYFLATIIGITPGTFTFVLLGSGLGDVVQNQVDQYNQCLGSGGQDCAISLAIKDLISPTLIAAFVAMGIVAIIPTLLKKYRDRRMTQKGPSQSSNKQEMDDKQ